MTDTSFQRLSAQMIDYIPHLRRYARSLVRTKDQADDLVQDCIERALSKISLYQPDTNLRAWLFTIMRNISITQARKEHLRRGYAAERQAIGRRSEAPSQAHTIALKESLRMLKELSPGERQAVTLLGVHDLSYEEAANISGLPVGTMKSRLSRGRQRLRTLTDSDDQASD
ncbi:MAG: sigma-70 family RNA polymerase sigma factor [Proteobacteria bacterium]|nr:sigma-70 family RNA polymerase sigma factor [Pseudomonadota bacterium]